MAFSLRLQRRLKNANHELQCCAGARFANARCRVVGVPPACCRSRRLLAHASLSPFRLEAPPPPPPPPSSVLSPRVVLRRVEKALANLPLALAEMGILAGLSALGTVIEQNKSYAYYIENYPLDPPVLGFVTYPFILDLQLDHIYTAWYFWGFNVLLAASLVACSRTTQWPSLSAARAWRFPSKPGALARQPFAAVLPRASVGDLAGALAGVGFQAFVTPSGRLYAFRGLVGKAAPLAVHASLLLCMAGFLTSSLCGFTGAAMVAEGGSFTIRDAMRPSSFLARLPASADDAIEVDSFRVAYYPDGRVSQFFSSLGVRDAATGARVAAVDMKVNVPLRWKGITAYQTDWGIAAVVLRAGSVGQADAGAQASQPLSLPMASLEGAAGFSGRIWGTVLPGAGGGRGGTLVARDFQSVALYDSTGAFVGVRRPGSGTPATVDGAVVYVDALVGSTGLELKADPGVPVVYAGFAGVMITTFLACLPHAQVWALIDAAGNLHVGGRSSKLKQEFGAQMEAICDTLPEYVDEG